MRIGIIFSDNRPVMSIGGLEGTIMFLWGRTEHIVSKDPMDDTLSTSFRFFIVQEGSDWRFDYRSNCRYPREEDQRIIDDLLAMANHAISERKATDLSREFTALDRIEPYNFGGLFDQMNDCYEPIMGYQDWNQKLAEMRERLRSSFTSDEIESDEHLRSFVFQTPLETIWVDDSSVTQPKDSA